MHIKSTAPGAALDTADCDAAGGQLAGLVQYLQKRLRTLEGENTSLGQHIARLKADLQAAANRATQADQARLETARCGYSLDT